MDNLTIVILTGGRSKRFQSLTRQEKFEYKINGKPLIIDLIEKLDFITSNIYLSVNSKEQQSDIRNLLENTKFSPNFIFDDRTLIQQGPMLGIVSSLKIIESDFVLFVPIDYPFIKINDYINLIQYCLENPVEFCSYKLPDGFITSTLFACNASLTSRRFSSILQNKDKRVSSLFRGGYATGLLEIAESQNQFINFNKPKIPVQINYANSDKQNIIKSPRTYWMFNRYLNEDESKCEHLKNEMTMWKGTHFETHIFADLQRLC